MATPRTKIPDSKLTTVVVPTVSRIAGNVSEVGHKALNAVEALLGTTEDKLNYLRDQTRIIRSAAAQEVLLLERQAIMSANSVLSDKATTAYDSFLNKIAIGKRVDKLSKKLSKEGEEGLLENSGSVKGAVTVDISPGVYELRRYLQKESQSILDKANEQVRIFMDQAFTLSNSTVKSIDSTLHTIEFSLSKVSEVCKTFMTLINLLKAPLIGLKVLIRAIKVIPLPQRYLVVSFTIVESDLLEKLEQLIAQTEEEIRAIEAIIRLVYGCLDPLRTRIERIRAKLNTFKTDNLILQATDRDIDILDQTGLYDRSTGRTIFETIQDGRDSNTGWEVYGDLDIDLTDPQIGRQVQELNPGDYLTFNGYTSGSYVDEYYKWSVDEPPYPKGDPEQEGWTRYPSITGRSSEDERLWKLSQLRTGTGIVFGAFDPAIEEVPIGEWDNLFKAFDRFRDVQVESKSNGTEIVNYDPLTGYSYGKVILILGEDNLDQKPGILKPSSWDALQIAALDKLRNLPLSSELQEYLMSLWQTTAIEEAGTSTLTSDAVAYRAANGELYYLRVLEDEHSPKVAVRRYVEVRDESNTIILEGTKTFSLDKEALIEEMKIRLDQLTR